MKTFDVKIAHFPPSTYSAATRSKARYQAWLSFSDTHECTFRDFQRITEVWSCPVPAIDGYDYIRRAYGVDVTVGQRVQIRNEGPGYNGLEGEVIYPGPSTQYVQVCLDGRDYPVNVHPLSIDPLTTESTS